LKAMRLKMGPQSSVSWAAVAEGETMGMPAFKYMSLHGTLGIVHI
jgi:hypothetical protein